MVLKHGRMVEIGPTEQIIHAPREDYTKALVSVRGLEHVEKDTAPPVLQVQNITARYRGTTFDVLKNVTVDLPAGQTLAVVGESGSGKSTLARVITGLLPPSGGRITFAGRELAADLKHRTRDDLREIQMIYQMADTAMNPRQTVGTIIGRPLEFYFGLRGAERDSGCRICWTRSKWAKGSTTAIRPNCRAGRSSVSALPAPWPPTPS